MTNDNTNRIDAYLSDSMSGKELQAFEIEMENDEELAAEVALYRLEHRAIELAVHDELRRKMQGWQGEATVTPTAATVRRLRWRRPLAIAASVLLIIGVGTSWWANGNYSDTALAITSNTYPKISQRGGALDALTQAQLALDKQAYTEALGYIQEEESYNAQLIRGAALLGLGQLRQGRETYEKVLQSSSKTQREMAQWQLVLIAIRDGQSDAAREALDTIINQEPPHNHRSQAEVLQQKLNSFWRTFTW